MFCPNCGHENNDENKFCMKCGKPFNQQFQSQPATDFTDQNYQYMPIPVENCIYKKGARIMRLVIGIVAIVLQLFIVFQSCSAGIVNSFAAPETMTGTAGFFLSIFMLAAGIVSVAARKTRGGTITAASLFLLGAVICKIDVGLFMDLIVWSYVSLIFAILLIISLYMKNNPDKYKKFSLDVIILSTIAALTLVAMITNDVKNNSIGTQSESAVMEESEPSRAAETTVSLTTTSLQTTSTVKTRSAVTTTVTNEKVDSSISLNMLGCYANSDMDLSAQLDKTGGFFTIILQYKVTGYYCVASGKIDSTGFWSGQALTFNRKENEDGGCIYTNFITESISITFMPLDDAFILKKEGCDYLYTVSKGSFITIPMNSFVNIDDGYLNVRDKAGNDGKVIDKLDNHEEIIVIDIINYEWAFTIYDENKYGFLSTDFISNDYYVNDNGDYIR